jgi:multiple sugar transport system permease protein
MAQAELTVTQAPPRRRRQTVLGEMVKHRADYLYVGPAIAVMALVILYPFVYTIYLSFHATPSYRPDIIFVGLENYREALSDPTLWFVVWNTIIWTFGSTAASFVLGLVAALIVAQDIKLRAFFRGALVLPYVIGHVTASYAWRWIFHADFGVVSGMLMQLGLIDRPILFLDSGQWVMASLVLVNTWKSFPFVLLLLLAGLQTIPEQLYKAAQIDGANRWRQFTEITLPQLMPVIMVTTILLIINNINSFTIPWVLTGGGPAGLSEILILRVYLVSFGGALNFGLASAISVILFIFLIVFAVAYVKALTRDGGSRREE